MIEDMRIRNLSPNTIACYVRQVAHFARHFEQSPARLEPEEVRAYQLHLVRQKVSFSTLNQATCALRFLYEKTLGGHWAVEQIPYAKRPKRLPTVLSKEEVERLLQFGVFLPRDEEPRSQRTVALGQTAQRLQQRRPRQHFRAGSGDQKNHGRLHGGGVSGCGWKAVWRAIALGEQKTIPGGGLQPKRRGAK